MKRHLCALCVGALLLPAGAWAQQAAAPADIPPHACQAPGEPPLQPPPDVARRYEKRKEAYKDCIKKYVDDLNDKIKVQLDMMRQYEKAANAAIEEYNAWANAANIKVTK